VFRVKNYRGPLWLSAVMLALLVAGGCAARARYCDEYHSDPDRGVMEKIARAASR
jgi:hypothetical protein